MWGVLSWIRSEYVLMPELEGLLSDWLTQVKSSFFKGFNGLGYITLSSPTVTEDDKCCNPLYSFYACRCQAGTVSSNTDLISLQYTSSIIIGSTSSKIPYFDQISQIWPRPPLRIWKIARPPLNNLKLLCTPPKNVLLKVSKCYTQLHAQESRRTQPRMDTIWKDVQYERWRDITQTSCHSQHIQFFTSSLLSQAGTLIDRYESLWRAKCSWVQSGTESSPQS